MRISDWSSDVCSSDLLNHYHSWTKTRIRKDITGSFQYLHFCTFNVNFQYIRDAGILAAEIFYGYCLNGNGFEDALSTSVYQRRVRDILDRKSVRVGKEFVITCSFRWSPNH